MELFVLQVCFHEALLHGTRRKLLEVWGQLLILPFLLSWCLLQWWEGNKYLKAELKRTAVGKEVMGREGFRKEGMVSSAKC